MRYRLVIETEEFGKGCPEDESESWTSKRTFHWVKDTPEDNEGFSDYQAEKYGSQDYSYRVNFKDVYTLDSETDLQDMKESIEQMFEEESR